jgi:O-antigen ligase
MYEMGEGMKSTGWIIPVVFYVIQAIAYYKIGEKANIKNRWVAFVPVVQIIVVLHVIDKSGWSIFLLLIPVVNLVLMIIWTVKFYKAFEVHVALIVLSIIIPLFGAVMALVIAFSDQFQYKGSTQFTA